MGKFLSVVREQYVKNTACSRRGKCMVVVNIGMERNSSPQCLGMTYYYIIVKGCAVLAGTAPSTYHPPNKKGNFVPVHMMKA